MSLGRNVPNASRDQGDYNGIALLCLANLGMWDEHDAGRKKTGGGECTAMRCGAIGCNGRMFIVANQHVKVTTLAGKSLKKKKKKKKIL
ncbi:hypothetical protein POVWA2_038570 [Plasmodium ovale wallikeri]|uniref:Uncharacterized protein n=1 Tax=Plasmodium ovale wallikeri TaxID=864142 RepID=A0A1A8Z642_PLAOA|nr:hypothetical protein POVWA1_039840 [Plasmodium ovale wallikeri]SBT39884.1 hypothetical protein POVWA2_038570 [Plasmodium ovale wallikeri]